MTRVLRSARGLALVVLVPWLIGAAGFAVAASHWLGGASRSPERPPAPAADPDRVKELRQTLVSVSAESAALRRELDRLVARQQATTSPPEASDRPDDASSPPQLDELAARIAEKYSLAAVGDEESSREADAAVRAALAEGEGGMEALREAYRSTADPRARALMLPVLLSEGGAEAVEFVADQLRQETDPELRHELIRQTALFASPRHAPQLKDTFLDVLAGEEDTELRAAAVRGLRYAKGDDVREALLAAASDTSEEVRLAAIGNLASSSRLRKELHALMENEPSSRVREVGECHLLLAGGNRGR